MTFRKKTILALLTLVFIVTGISSLSVTKNVEAAGECKIMSLGFDKGGFYGKPINADGSVGDNVETIINNINDPIANGLVVSPTNFITKQINQPNSKNDINRQLVTLNVKSEGCQGKHIEIKIHSKDGFLNANDEECCTLLAAVTKDDFSVNYEAGEDNCLVGSANVDGELIIGYNCIYWVDIFENGTSIMEGYTDQKKNTLNYQCVDNSTAFSNICHDSDRGWALINFNGLEELNQAGNPIGNNASELNTDSPCYDANALGEGKPGYKPGCNALLAPLPGLATIDSNISIGQYINTIVQVAIGILTALAVVMLIIVGIDYMTTGSITGKAQDKGRIQNILLGLLVAIGSFVILYTINPNLLNLQPGIDRVSIDYVQVLSSSEYQAITGKLPPTSPEVDALAHKVAAAVGIPYCVFPAIFSTESQGRAGVIGHDENVKKSTLSNIGARTKFLNSGKKFSGDTFTQGDDEEFNDDGTKTKLLKPGEDGLGLDWRFSHGIGLTQFTFNTENQDLTSPTRNVTGYGSITPKQAFDPETNLTAGGSLYKYYLNECGGDIRAAFDAYGDGSCTKRPDNNGGQNPAKKYATYQTCVQKFGTES